MPLPAPPPSQPDSGRPDPEAHRRAMQLRFVLVVVGSSMLLTLVVLLSLLPDRRLLTYIALLDAFVFLALYAFVRSRLRALEPRGPGSFPRSHG